MWIHFSPSLSIELNEVKGQVKKLEVQIARISDMYLDMCTKHESLRRAFEESQMRSVAPDAVDPVTSLLELKRRREPESDATDDSIRDNKPVKFSLVSHPESGPLSVPQHPALVSRPEASREVARPIAAHASGGLVRMISLDPSATQVWDYASYLFISLLIEFLY
jgi:hypothetical protein